MTIKQSPISFTITVAVLICTQTIAAPVKPPTTTQSAKAPVVKPTQPPLALNSVAPSIQLPVANSSSAGNWKSTDALGQGDLKVLVISPKVPATELQNIRRVLTDSVTAQLTGRELTLAVVFPEAATATRYKLPADSSHLVQLLDKAGQLRPYIGKQSGLILISIDNAGFLRRVENVKSSQLADKVLKPESLTPFILEGRKAPAFAIRDMNGRVRRLHDLRGRRNLLLTFFPKCFTHTCAVQLTSLQAEYTHLLEQDTEVWGVSIDPAAGEKGQLAFARKLQLGFPLIPDVNRNLSLLYGAVQSPNQVAIRMSILIDKNGTVRWINKQIQPDRHGLEVLDKLRELGLGKGAK